MSKVVIVSRLNVGSHAGQKAPFDVRSIALDLGCTPVDLAPYNSTSKMTRLLSSFAAAFRLVSSASLLRHADGVITQHPLGKVNDLIFVALTRSVPVITLIHDLEMLRWSKHSLRETQRLEESELLISPTPAMSEYIRERLPAAAILDLDRFDYIVTAPPEPAPASTRPRRILVAGSLDPLKAPYVYGLRDLALPLDLYGPACRTEQLQRGVEYRGLIATAHPALNERNGFGLVWDGTSTTELAGPTGRYLRYNAPHKFSLYMALGLPVLVARDSALAPLVLRHGLGLVIEDIPSAAEAAAGLPSDRWGELLSNVSRYREGLLRGERTRAVLIEALRSVGLSPQRDLRSV